MISANERQDRTGQTSSSHRERNKSVDTRAPEIRMRRREGSNRGQDQGRKEGGREQEREHAEERERKRKEEKNMC